MTGQPFFLFRLGEVPVFATPWFFLIVAALSFDGGLQNGLIYAAALLLSLLVHESGHAAVAAAYRLEPAIVLHGFGGLCAHRPAARDSHRAWITVAGPLAGLALAALSAVGAVLATLAAQPALVSFFGILVFLNLLLNLGNLLPVYPLDGGQLFSLAMRRWLRPGLAEQVTHGTGIAVAAAMIGVSGWFGFTFAALIFALLLFENIQALRAPLLRRARPGDRDARERLEEAEAALREGDPAAAARLGHQVRALPQLAEDHHDAALEVIALGSLLSGRREEGLAFAAKAPETPRLVAAVVRALLEAGDPDEARRWMDTPAWRKVPADVRAALTAPYDA